MKIELSANIAQKAHDALAAAGCHEIAESIKTRLARYGNPDALEVDVLSLGRDGLQAIYALAKGEGERALMMQITSYRNIIESPFEAKIGNLKSLPAGLIAFLSKNCIDGWLYHKEEDGVFLPWLVREIKYVASTQHNPASVYVRLSANTAKHAEGQREYDITTDSIGFFADEIAKRSIPEVLSAKGYYHETPELKASYESDLAHFSKYRPQFGAQFSGVGMALVGSGYKRKFIELHPGSKLVNDEENIRRVIVDHVDDSFWEAQKGCPVFNIQPYHCRLFMFHLGLHEHMWIHVSCLKPYEYRPELRDKLILPDLHRDLIDILTTDMDIIMEDIVNGKSGGTTILCKGAPGLGKTLTAEVYAECVKKPLYRVHSGQLGTDAESVENALAAILSRAARWGSVLLLDEADVFVRKRDNDIQHNAVVAAFLRTLEYFHGLLFMTTNRADDIDDAIISRCIAIIKYEQPSKADAKRIWNVLAQQFELSLSPALVEDLVSLFKDASGRDIKELLKLTSKFARVKGIPLDIEAFRQCAMFRGLL